jgi:hypothetical protein
MTEKQIGFLNLLFEKGEEVCVSPNKYGYHSISQDAIGESMTLVSPNTDYGPSIIKDSDINLIAVNPIKGFRKDENVTTFRSFMIEIDELDLASQIKYIEESKLPYSACVFSGNKSLHYAITLDVPLPNIEVWRFYNQWLLNCLPLTDQQIKNPSRSIRFPDNWRHNGNKLRQSLVELKTRITQEDFFRWLYSHEDKKPIQRKERVVSLLTEMPSMDSIPTDVRMMLMNGIVENRNASWFYVGCRFAAIGYDFEKAVEDLSGYFTEDKDFKRREWEGCLKSAYKRINGDSHG